MHRDGPWFGPLLVQQASGTSMQISLLGGGQVFVDRGPNNGVCEAQRLSLNENRKVDETSGQAVGASRIHCGQLSAHRQPCLFAKDGHRSSQRRCLRVEATYAQQHRCGDALRRHVTDCLGIDLASGAPPAAKLAEKFEEQKRIATGRVRARATQLRTGILSQVRPDHLPHRGFTQRPGSEYGRARFQ